MVPNAEKHIVKIRENLPQIISRWRPWLPHLLVVFWLLYLGLAIWQHALHSVQPPIYDPLSYMQKAMNFWQAVEHGKLFNPLNLEPTYRPPGTILMSYPFGFSPDFQGFHFRSVFVPILCVVAAVYIVAGTNRTRASSWWVAAIVLLFSSLPMFYQFDMADVIDMPTRWGLVDNFQAGIAAMAAAAMVRSLMTRSLSWLLFGTSLAAFTLLIKPSGLMVMALTALTWLILVSLEWLKRSRLKSPDPLLRVYSVKGGALILGVYACVVAACVFSGYFSSANFAFAKQSLVIMRSFQIDIQQTVLLFHKSSGEGLVLWVIGVGVLFVLGLPIAREGCQLLTTRVLGLLVGSLIIWCSGAWYWLVVQAGGGQIRYFYPFMLMGAVCIIPVALDCWTHANRPIRIFLMAVCIIPALNIGGLLAAGDDPAISWQKSSGVSISVGRDREEVRQAYDLLNRLRKTKTAANVYSFADGTFSAIFENIGAYEEMVRPKLPSFRSVLPIDWARGFAVRVEELLDCDYILIRKSENKNVNGLLEANKFYLETRAFQNWLATLNERSGVEIVSDGRDLRLLRIVDRRALNRAIETFVSTHSWRPEFVAANSHSTWWNADAVSAHTRNLAAEEIDFSGIYKVHALSINRVDNGIKIDVWWEELRHDELNDQRLLFLHLVDSSGNILHSRQIALHPYNPFNKERRWRHAEMIFPLQFPDMKVAKLAFGVNHPNGTLLLPDKGSTDWDGRRVLLPVTEFTGAKSPPLLPAKLN